jgi:hypothetical protein
MNDAAHERRRVLVRFKDALADFSDDPSPANLERYLQASRALDESRPRRRAGRARSAQRPIR